MLGLCCHLLHEPGTLDHIGETRIVLHVGGDRELAARLQAGHQDRRHAGSRGIDRSRVASRAGADDQDARAMGLGHGDSSRGDPTIIGCDDTEFTGARRAPRPPFGAHLRPSSPAISLARHAVPGNVTLRKAPAAPRATQRMKKPNGEPPLLDAIDRRILAELQADGRMTNVELARRAGISAPPCLRRVRRLEEGGIIRGYHADPDPQKLGWEITVFAIVGLDSQKEAVLSAFEQLVAGWPEVRECHMIRGGGDFLLKFVARDTAHENQLTQRLTGSPTVTRVQTLQTIRTSRSLAGVPL